MAVVLAVILALVPLVITPASLFYFDVTPKVSVTLWGAAILLLLTGVGGLRGLRSTREGRWFSILLAAAAVSLAISTALSVRPLLSLVGTNWRRYGLAEQYAVLLLAAAAGEAAAQGGGRLLLRTMAATGIPVALYGALQYFGWDPWLPAAAYHVGEGMWTIVRPPSTLGYVSYFANWLLFPLFSGIAMWCTEERGAWRILGLAAAVLTAAAIALSGTRAAMMGLGAGAVFLWLWFKPRISRRGLVISAVLAGAAVLFYVSPAGQPLRSRARWYIEDAWGGARPWLWRDSALMATHRMAAGAGPETFALVFPRYESKELAAAYPDFYHESAHNIFLDALTAQGLPGCAILAALCAVGFHAAFRVRSRAAGVLAAALAGALLAQQFVVFTLPAAVYFFVALGLLVGLGTKPQVPRYARGAVLAAALPAAALAVCGFWLLAADRAQFAVRRALETGDLAQVLSVQAPRARRLRLFDELWYSRALTTAAAKTGDMLLRLRAEQEALAAAERATVRSDTPQNAWYHLAQLYAAKNDFAGTERSLRAAIAVAPNWFKPHWILARLLALEGRHAEARAEGLIAIARNHKDPEVARALAEIDASVKRR